MNSTETTNAIFEKISGFLDDACSFDRIQDKIRADIYEIIQRSKDTEDDYRRTLINALIWARADLYLNGPGPTGGYAKRVGTLAAVLGVDP